MRIGVDVSGIFTKYRTGVPNVYYGLIEGLAALVDETDDLQFALIDRSLEAKHTLGMNLPYNFEFRSTRPISHLPTWDSLTTSRWVGKPMQIWNRGMRELARRATGWQKQVEEIVADVDVLEGWDAWLYHAPRAKRIIILTDIIPILLPHLFGDEQIRNLRRSISFAQNTADRVVTISHHAKQTFVEKAGIPADKITVIYLGVRSIFRCVQDHSVIEPVLKRYGIPEKPYVLSIGYLDQRKNVQGHVRAFERLVEQKRFHDLQMVLVGAPSYTTAQVLRDVGAADVRERIHITGYVPDENLPLLLSGASAFVYCSFFEGFGYPVLEAMACGVPVVTSNTTSLPEISGDAALLVDPHNVDAIAEALERVLTDETLRGELRIRGLARVRQFTWENWARGHLQVYRECYAAR